MCCAKPESSKRNTQSRFSVTANSRPRSPCRLTNSLNPLKKRSPRRVASSRSCSKCLKNWPTSFVSRISEGASCSRSRCWRCTVSAATSPLLVSMPTDCSSSLNRRSEEHTSELQSRGHLVCRLLLERHVTLLDLHSFPTRRSSDLKTGGKFEVLQ